MLCWGVLSTVSSHHAVGWGSQSILLLFPTDPFSMSHWLWRWTDLFLILAQPGVNLDLGKSPCLSELRFLHVEGKNGCHTLEPGSTRSKSSRIGLSSGTLCYDVGTLCYLLLLISLVCGSKIRDWTGWGQGSIPAFCGCYVNTFL